ncbi:FUSC family protein [Francisella sp. SYW-9]|uniref:FUSC family protein n=1 Tax=Francisella sp. SYW-9 TaxID=2610888 RepID=UPI00123D71DB|nr:FUSC family protein [Francisella sp. SYW-9]
MIHNIFTSKNFIYTFKSCIAITLALTIAIGLDLNKPMWAMIAALFLQIRPETAFIIEKAIILILVSFIGVITSFTIVKFFLPYPILAIFSLCIFMTITMYFSVSMSHSNFIYGFTLANITCIIVIFYSIADPSTTTEQSIFNTGYSRITEMMVGSICSCLVNYYIFPVKIKNTLKKHTTNSLEITIKYIKQILSFTDINNNEKYNKQVENILNSLVTLDNDLTASKYENLNNNNYRKFLNRIVELIQAAHCLRKKTIKHRLNYPSKIILNKISDNIDNLLTNQKEITINSDNLLLNDVISKLNAVVKSYKQLNTEHSILSKSESYYSLKNYNNLIVTSIKISRTIFLLIFLSIFWIIIQGNSSLLMMLVIPCLLSQLFMPAPDSLRRIQNAIIGITISIPVSFITLTILSQVTGYFELLILVLLASLFIGIIILPNPKYQAFSIGFCLGTIALIQPSNHMTFEVSKSLTTGLSAVFGCGLLWLVSKLYPHSPYTITRKFTIKSIVKDNKKLHHKEISRKQYHAIIIKKILCIYKNRKDDGSSERDIQFALNRLND